MILHIDSEVSASNKDALKVEFKRVEYDVEQAARAVEDSVLPNKYANNLREAN